MCIDNTNALYRRIDMKYCILFVIKIIIRFALYLDNIHIDIDDCLAPNEQFRSYILA